MISKGNLGDVVDKCDYSVLLIFIYCFPASDSPDFNVCPGW